MFPRLVGLTGRAASRAASECGRLPDSTKARVRDCWRRSARYVTTTSVDSNIRTIRVLLSFQLAQVVLNPYDAGMIGSVAGPIDSQRPLQQGLRTSQITEVDQDQGQIAQSRCHRGVVRSIADLVDG